jgi:hypothetical protein
LFWFCLLSSATWAQLSGENLLQKQPLGYKVGFQATRDHTTVTELMPEGESVENWTEMVTVQVFRDMKASPDVFQKTVKLLWMNACPNGTVTAPVMGNENGYPSAYWAMRCPLNSRTGKPEATFVKTIKGNDAFYVIQKAFTFAPSNEQTALWVQYLRAIQVCDERLADRRCSASEVWKLSNAPDQSLAKPGTQQ